MYNAYCKTGIFCNEPPKKTSQVLMTQICWPGHQGTKAKNAEVILVKASLKCSLSNQIIYMFM